MTKKQHDFYLIQQNAVNIGFIAVNKSVEVERGYFLHKFYLDQTLAGRKRNFSA